MNKANKRYFCDSPHEKPSVGNLSPTLRKALNLENDMLPFWIYRMRILGYPPAWLQAAESKTLDVFDGSSTKNSCLMPNVGLEDGECQDKLKYNKDTLIEFPGFNAPVPSNVKDDWVILGMPPYQQNQQLSVASQSMQFVEPVPYKRAKLDTSKDEASNSSNSSDLDNTSGSQPENSLLEKISTSSQVSSSNEELSASLKVDDNEDDGSKSANNSFAETNNNHLEDSNSSGRSSSSFDDKSFNNTTTSNHKLKQVSCGTPVPESVKPKLPALEKWSIGMGELLHFENLPNSTGAYQNLKGILDKIKNRFQK